MKRILTTLCALAFVMAGSIPALAAEADADTGQSASYYCTTAPMSSEVLERAASVSRSSPANLWARSTAASVLAASAS